ncbi:hypothetical protein CWE13_00465 [Aliidiomarina shirensis]|uniref:Uncharacterized protein n=1 Tax=Aliidiomarina shirensis TaxID=1048642 RepID=A0A432WWK1_9GAMM|nr:hypothetical protein CWE13_00465 [Aliidiomarina shirensis]
MAHEYSIPAHLRTGVLKLKKGECIKTCAIIPEAEPLGQVVPKAGSHYPCDTTVFLRMNTIS